MAITPLDLKFRQSERMTDFDDGGGRMSSVEIVDNSMNNVFSDRSDLDGILGRVSLRSLFFQVNTANTDTYLGAFLFLTDPPADPNVTVSLFTTGPEVVRDVRADARDYVEAYRTTGVVSRLVLYGNHPAGVGTLQLHARPDVASPDIGDVLVLSVEAPGYAPFEQYVSVREVAQRTTQTFTDGAGDFQRDVLLLTLNERLAQAFVGQDPPRRIDSDQVPPTRVRLSQVTDAARYYGQKPVLGPVTAPTTSVDIGDPYIPIVPSSRVETPITDALAGLGSLAMVESGPAGALSWSGSVSGTANVPVIRYLGSPYARRSLTVTVGSVTLHDDGGGGLVPENPADVGWSGAADYETGAVSIVRDTGWSGTVTLEATPAGAVLEQGYTMTRMITANNRALAQVFQLPMRPAPGTAVMDYRSLGKWIRLHDNGAGQMVGNPGEGSGTLNYDGASAQVTLGSLPDVDSPIIWSWGVDLRARKSVGEITIPTPQYRQQLDQEHLTPGSLTMAWDSDGTPRTATADATGQITGDATGYVDEVAGVAWFTTEHTPDTGITYSYTAVAGGYISEVFTPALAGGQVTVQLSQAPAAELSISATWQLEEALNDGRKLYRPWSARAAGGGGWVGTNGTINPTTGELVIAVETLLAGGGRPWSLNPAVYDYTPVYVPGQSNPVDIGPQPPPGTPQGQTQYPSAPVVSIAGWAFASGSPLVVRYLPAGVTPTAHNETHPLPPVEIFLGNGVAGPLVPGAVRFTFRGRTYVDRAGTLLHSVSASTNTGQVAGSIDYSNCVATLTDYDAGGNTVNVVSLLSRYVEPGVSGVFFRAPGSPLSAGQFTLRAVTLDGVQLLGSADVNGLITGDSMAGEVDWTTGAARLDFGDFVTAAGNESEPWYNPALIDSNGEIWRPRMVDASSIFFGCVVWQRIPTDPELTGIDPVRLPSDGRVVGFQAGGIGALTHTQETLLTPTAGQVVNLGRENIAFVEIFDADRQPVEDTWYTVDLAAGTVTWSDPLNLSGYTMPICIRDRIQHISQIADVHPAGQITFTVPVPRDFPAGAVLSAGLPMGDLQARVANIFDQATWANQWRNVVEGAPAAGNYNTLNYPIEVENDSATDDRWAFVFQSNNTVLLLSEHREAMGPFSILDDIAPINPVSGKPFFTIRADGWGGGWSAGNALRFNTVSATAGMWAARVTLPGTIAATEDRVRINAYGNAH